MSSCTFGDEPLRIGANQTLHMVSEYDATTLTSKHTPSVAHGPIDLKWWHLDRLCLLID